VTLRRPAPCRAPGGPRPAAVRRRHGPGIGPLALVALCLVALAVPPPAAAIGWGGIEPAITTLEQVRERWGPPTKETRGREEGYETVQWIYEGPAAPSGMKRMTVDFGLVRPDGYKRELVRALRLEPKPLIFGRKTVAEAFGQPDLQGIQDSVPMIVYNTGLFVFFDQQGETAVLLLFTPPLPPGGAGGAPASTPPAPGPGPGSGQGAPAPRPR
jgi:hypothetical protein